jgi:hypothetical protein
MTYLLLNIVRDNEYALIPSATYAKRERTDITDYELEELK